MSSKNIFFIGLIFVLSIFTRFYGLNWGNGHFFHPDENNMATALSQLSDTNFNPHFFAYGQFPLYLGYFTLKLLSISNIFTNSVFVLRFWSAIFSLLTIVVSLFLSKILFKKYWYLFSLLLVFTPGLIQLAHFGTTESLLIFVFITNIFLAFKYHQSPNTIFVLIAGFTTGIGMASKLTAIFFMLPLIISIIYKRKIYSLVSITVYCLLIIFFAILFSPYNFIAYSNFISAFNYESAVAIGSQKIFYTSQFLHTTPYLFQLIKVFPYSQGLPILLLSFISLLFIKSKKIYLFILLPSFIYILFNGQLYVKWFRFMSPLFIVIPLLTSYLLVKISNRVLKYFLLIICLIPGLYFFKLYLSPDIRQSASVWINQNIPPNSVILSEAGNVINLPLGSNQYQVTNFDFYNLDSDPILQNQLPSIVGKSDYIIIPSRRIFKNQNNPDFPNSLNYYQQLFSGQLGFKLIKEFRPNNQLLLESESAEETFSVFDQPTIRIYQKIKS